VLVTVGIALGWLGYTIFYFGLNRITGGNDSFHSVIWPGAYKPTPRDA
jgi:hypothetical protein